MEDIKQGKIRNHFSIKKDLTYIEHQELRSAISSTDFIVVSILYDHFFRPGYVNEYFNFEIYNAKGERIEEIEVNGWKLKFGGPIQDRGFYNQYRTFTCHVASPTKTDDYIHVKNLYIGIDDFITAIKRVKSISESYGKSLPSALWQIEDLNDEVKRLDKLREDLASKVKELEFELQNKGESR